MKIPAKRHNNFSFTVREYLEKRSEVITRAMTELKNRNYSRTEIEDYIDSVFRTMKQNSVVWYSNVIPFKDGDRLYCLVEGKELSGTVHLSPKCITVSLDGTNLFTTAQLLDITPLIYTEDPFENSPASDLGIIRAKELMIDLIFKEINIFEK